jgi:phosphatidate cytidylyltransferase
MLKTRVLTAALLLVVFLPALFWLPKLHWALLMALVAAVAAWEWGGLAGLQARGRLAFGGLMLGVCAAWTYAYTPSPNLFDLFMFVLAPLFWILALPFWLWWRWRPGKIVLLCLGFVLISATWHALVVWRVFPPCPWLLLAVMGIAWVADMLAYFAGRAFGGRKLAPNISPGKTWAGVWGALAGAVVYGVILSRLLDPLPGETVVVTLLLVFLVPALAVLGILGDLLESLLKRQAGVKDSSNILPGHGGVLDRIDSQMAILPCAFWLFCLPLSFTHYW